MAALMGAYPREDEGPMFELLRGSGSVVPDIRPPRALLARQYWVMLCPLVAGFALELEPVSVVCMQLPSESWIRGIKRTGVEVDSRKTSAQEKPEG